MGEINKEKNTTYRTITTILFFLFMMPSCLALLYMGPIYFLFFWYLSIYFHELGHFLAARLVGFNNVTVTIGSRREIFKKRYKNITLIINSGFDGLTNIKISHSKYIKLKLAVFYLGGVFVNGLIVFLLFLFRGNDMMNGNSDILVAFVTSNMFTFVHNLTPLIYKKNGIKKYSDGLQLLKLPFMKEKDIEDIIKNQEISEAFELSINKEYALAAKAYEKLIEKNIRYDEIIINYSQSLIVCLRLDEARKILLDLIKENHDCKNDSLIQNNLAWTYLLEMRSESVLQADKFSSEAIRLDPTSSYIKNTRGCVLIALGRIDEGIEMLESEVNVISSAKEKPDNSIECMFLAYGYLKKGDKNQVHKCLQYLNSISYDSGPDKAFIFEILKQKTSNFHVG